MENNNSVYGFLTFIKSWWYVLLITFGAGALSFQVNANTKAVEDAADQIEAAMSDRYTATEARADRAEARAEAVERVAAQAQRDSMQDERTELLINRIDKLVDLYAQQRHERINAQ